MSAAASTAFTVTAKMEAMPDQFASWTTRGRTYHVPVHGFAFDATYGEPFCLDTSKQTNPYHAAAECVIATGRKSELCVLSDGSTGAGDTQRMLLPSLYATWRLSAAFRRNDKFYSLVEPFTPGMSNSSTITDSATIPPLTLLADVTLVQATKTARTSLRSETETDAASIRVAAASSCCAADEYKAPSSGQCSKCPLGATAALSGYTCT